MKECNNDGNQERKGMNGPSKEGQKQQSAARMKREKERKKKERRTGKSPNMKGADVVRQFKGSRYRLTVVAPNLHFRR